MDWCGIHCIWNLLYIWGGNNAVSFGLCVATVAPCKPFYKMHVSMATELVVECQVWHQRERKWGGKVGKKVSRERRKLWKLACSLTESQYLNPKSAETQFSHVRHNAAVSGCSLLFLPALLHPRTHTHIHNITFCSCHYSCIPLLFIL